MQTTSGGDVKVGPCAILALLELHIALPELSRPALTLRLDEMPCYANSCLFKDRKQLIVAN